VHASSEMFVRRVHSDARGHLHSLSGLPFAPREVLTAVNVAGTLKGLHRSPYAKVVYVVSGLIHDFYTTHDAGRASFEWALGPGESVLVPAGASHGYYCAEDSTVLYLLQEEHDPARDETWHWRSPGLGFAHPFLRAVDRPLIVSKKDGDAPYFGAPYDYLVLGSEGWLGSPAAAALRAAGKRVLGGGGVRLRDHAAIADLVRRSGARFVVCAAGISGRPTIEWSETHELETYETNFLDTCELMRICRDAGVHLTLFGSGLVFGGRTKDGGTTDEEDYTEEDEADLTAKVYCRYRVMLESVVRRLHSDRVLYLRIVFPCTLDGHPRCFASKMKARASSVHDARVPVTVVPDLFPLLPRLIEGAKATGVLNFACEGRVSLPELVRALAWPPGTPVNVVESFDKAGAGDYGLSTDRLRALLLLGGGGCAVPTATVDRLRYIRIPSSDRSRP